jgi:hypothetical protein
LAAATSYAEWQLQNNVCKAQDGSQNLTVILKSCFADLPTSCCEDETVSLIPVLNIVDVSSHESNTDIREVHKQSKVLQCLADFRHSDGDGTAAPGYVNEAFGQVGCADDSARTAPAGQVFRAGLSKYVN